MATLLIPLVGPLQAWGLDARFDLRQTAPEPSKSGVLGLICCCLGRDRSQPIEDLTALAFGVRVDRDGQLLRDFHTAMDVVGSGDSKTRTVVSNRWYLADAAFMAAVEGPAPMLQQIHRALAHPHWMPSLGRRSCIPTVPLASGGMFDLSILDALIQAPPLVKGAERLKVVIDDINGSIVRPDQPLAAFSTRQFGSRRMRSFSIPAPIPVAP